MRRLLAMFLCAAIAAPGCATAGGGRVAAEPKAADPAVIAEYVQRLPLGSPVRVDLAGGRTVRGTLIKAAERSLVVQPRTRMPEPPLDVPIADVIRVTPDSPGGNNLAKAIGAGVAAGAGGALLVFAILAAIYSN